MGTLTTIYSVYRNDLQLYMVHIALYLPISGKQGFYFPHLALEFVRKSVQGPAKEDSKQKTDDNSHLNFSFNEFVVNPQGFEPRTDRL